MMDINCDLGEGEPIARTRRILRWVTSANIACGGHAGSVRTMRSCLRLCGKFGVNAGAHPGFVDPGEFRAHRDACFPCGLESLIESQVGRFGTAGGREKVFRSPTSSSMGRFTMLVERDRRLSDVYVGFVKERFPGMRILASPNGCVISTAERLGLEVWAEVFSDRAYTAGGDLMPRSEPGAVLRDLAEIKMRMETFLATGGLPLKNGSIVKISAQTVCVHADSPGALRIARLLAKLCTSVPEPYSR